MNLKNILNKICKGILNWVWILPIILIIITISFFEKSSGIIVIDGCQYLKYDRCITHKGNCTNIIHQNFSQ